MEQKRIGLLKRVLSLPPTIQLYHWQTRSNARHQAAGKLYEALVGLNDEFMEVYMGKHHRINPIQKMSLTVPCLNSRSAVAYIKDNIQFFANLESYLPELKTCTDLLSIRDMIVSELNRTLYLFTLR